MDAYEYDNKFYDGRHGGPFDRGAADSYYSRGRRPHFYRGATATTDLVEDLTPKELEAYNAGYDYNEQFGDKKQWN